MFNNVKWVRNPTGIGNNATKIADNTAARRDCDKAVGIAVNATSDTIIITMPNSVLNRDWSNSVPGKQFRKGAGSIGGGGSHSSATGE